MSEWRHLEQRRCDQEVLRGAGSEGLHLEQSWCDQQLLREARSEWSHLEQRGGSFSFMIDLI